MSAATIKLRADLVFSQHGGPEGGAVVVKDPARGRFFRFREAEDFILRQLDGATSLELVRQRVEERFGSALPTDVLQRFVEKLRHLGLLDEGALPSLAREPGRIRGDFFYLRFKAFDPDQLLSALSARLGFFFTPLFVAASAAVVLLALGLTVGNWAEIWREVQSLWRFESLFAAWVVMLGVIVLHEFAHGLTCKHFGGRVHEMGFLLIYLQPAFYCNVSDAWLFPEKSKRLWVTFAGAYFEMFLWALATGVWRLTEPGTTIHYLALMVTATSAIKSLFNLNPLIKLDGYYLLSDYLDVPNLRRRAFGFFGERFRRLWSSGAQPVGAVTPRERRIYVAYGILAGTYSYWLLGLVAWSLAGFLVGRYQGWGFVLFVALWALVFRQSLRRMVEPLFSRHAWSQRATVGFRRLLKVLSVLAVLFAVLWFCPMQLRISGPFTILPNRNAEVRAEVEEVIQRVYVDQGDAVKQGDLIASLSDRDYCMALNKAKAELEEKQARLNLLNAGARPEEIELAKTLIAKAEEHSKYARTRLEMYKDLFERKLAAQQEFEEAQELQAVRKEELHEAHDHLKLLLAGSRKQEIEAVAAAVSGLKTHCRYLEGQIQLLAVRSPIDGVITTHKLKERVGRNVKKGDLIAEVHEMNTVSAEIAVPEKEMADVKLGQKVVLKVRAHPGRRFEGVVTAIAPVATPPDESWRERTFLVTTRLDNAAGLLKPEMTGNVKIYCGEQRLLDIVLRRMVRFIRVEFWSWW